MTRRSLRALGFTLLEVMVSTAILGLTLTVILSAQGGLAASTKSAKMMGMAITLGRCKMTEVEQKLLQFGYAPIDDIQTEVPCCNEETAPGYKCDYKAELVVMPNPPSQNQGGEGGMALSSPLGSGMGSSNIATGAGGLPTSLDTALSAMNPATAGSGSGAGGSLDLNSDGGGLAQLKLDGGIQDMGNMLLQQMGGGGMGTQGLLNVVMGFVYPFLKPMMEVSIRRLTVVVHYMEGSKLKDFTLVQYITNPQNGGFLDGYDGGATGSGSGAGAGATPATTSTAGSLAPLRSP
jgi:general secretion pathway protein I